MISFHIFIHCIYEFGFENVLKFNFKALWVVSEQIRWIRLVCLLISPSYGIATVWASGHIWCSILGTDYIRMHIPDNLFNSLSTRQNVSGKQRLLRCQKVYSTVCRHIGKKPSHQFTWIAEMLIRKNLFQDNLDWCDSVLYFPGLSSFASASNFILDKLKSWQGVTTSNTNSFKNNTRHFQCLLFVFRDVFHLLLYGMATFSWEVNEKITFIYLP